MTTINHIAFIMDGNRRWAEQKHFPTAEGHRRGYNKLKDVANWCIDRGIKTTSFYAFSIENWNRGKEEIEFLMKLFHKACFKEADLFNKNGIKINVIGSKKNLSEGTKKDIQYIHTKTKHNKSAVLNLCFNYGGRLEIVEAIKKILKKGFKAKEITEELIQKHMWYKGQSDPELIIRTSGEQRLSGFLTWESVYSEFYFPKCHWPEFSEKDLDDAIADFEKRNRRFGGN
jgi:undecaprenyl diphosphate synthase